MPGLLPLLLAALPLAAGADVSYAGELELAFDEPLRLADGQRSAPFEIRLNVSGATCPMPPRSDDAEVRLALVGKPPWLRIDLEPDRFVFVPRCGVSRQVGTAEYAATGGSASDSGSFLVQATGRTQLCGRSCVFTVRATTEEISVGPPELVTSTGRGGRAPDAKDAAALALLGGVVGLAAAVLSRRRA